MWKRWLTGLLSVVLAVALAACGGNAGETAPPAAEPAPQGEESPAEAPAESSAEAAYPLTVTDASGTDVVFEKAPERIVSIAPSETEVLFAVGAGANVVGVDDWSDFPADVEGLPRVGGLEANVEAILELEPDVVFAGWSMSAATIEELRKLGLTVYAFETQTLDEAIAHIREVGKIVDNAAEAEAVAVKMEADRQKVVDAVAGLTDAEKKKVYVEFSPGWTVGKGEFMDELLTLAGGVNVADQPGWYEISEENIIEANPEVILYSAGVEGLEGIITGRAGWSKIDALANGQMFAIDDNLISRPGPRLTEALLEVAKALYPERIGQ
ncbi:ABC transporter substrate-binding protein [Paenibacillus antri]|uniref:ABC transporter substrate-binding protein n=1 Tax=Paenibacillus antri TaxID=2582848 RepID=A0A5R9G520_9BACL|nr:ABC transporter substrate-binding protein [Paenibacillus antri]TLS51467.1 ABC transporter substrate-binding protein [Paenibacillus antri]